MIKFHIKSAFRYIRSNKISSTLNIIGLSVSFAIFILLGCYVDNEFNIGKNILGSDKIYRVQSQSGSNISYKTYELLIDIPGIKASTHLMESWSMKQYFVHDNQSYASGKILYSTSDFFRVFSYKSIYGNLENALNSPNDIVLTKSQSLKIFGIENTVGKKITFKSTAFGDIDYQVSAILEDLPENDMLQFSCIMSHQSLKNFDIDSRYWGNANYEAYVCLSEMAHKTNIESSLNRLFKQNAPEWLVKDSRELNLKVFRSLYFDNSFDEYILEHNNKSSIWTMVILAVIILLAGAINFINLSTAQKEKKKKTIAVCYANGASKSKIFLQFLIETILFGGIAFLFAIILVALFYPLFNHLNRQDFSFWFFLQFIFIKGYWTVPFIFTAISGIIVALYFQLGKYHLPFKGNKKGKEHFRTGLLVMQFVVSIILIISTFVIQKQNKYLFNRPVGFQKNGIVCVPLIGELAERTSALGDEFLKIPGVTAVSYASDILGQHEGGQNGMSISNNGEERYVQYNIIQVDSSFFKLMGLKIISGQGFTNASIKEKDHIFNQTALQKFEITDIKNTRVTSYSNARGNIVGVVQNFNFQSLHSPITPMAFVCKKPENLGYAYLKLSDISTKNINSVVKNAKNIWKQFIPNWPFEYYFLDKSLAKLYEKDQSFAKLSFVLTILTVFIACLGLLGITMFLIESKTKEIGIRKVNGAKISEILLMFNKDFVKWVAIAFFIAMPIAGYAMNKWLESFAYKTNLSWWIFALAGVLALGIALLTVSWQSWRAATRNPVEALRYE